MNRIVASLLAAISLFYLNPVASQCIPQLTCPTAAAVQICDETNNSPQTWNAFYWWDALVGSHDLADAVVDLSVVATDDCSNGNFTFQCHLFLDLDGDGVQETVVSSDNWPSPGTVRFDNANTPNYTGGTSRVFDQQNIPAPFKYRFALQIQTGPGGKPTARLRWKTSGLGNNYSLPQLPYGTHRVQWTVTNSGGNTSICEYNFTVRDCLPPTVKCYNGLSINVAPTTMATIWATDYLQHVFDNHTPPTDFIWGPNQIHFAVSRADVDTFPLDANGNPVVTTVFTCNDVGEVHVRLWAIDLYGNASFCETTVFVQDINSNCTPNPDFSTIGTMPDAFNTSLKERQGNMIGASGKVAKVTIQPNPTTTGTTMFIHLEKAESCRFELMDMSGKLLWNNDYFLEEERNQVEIPSAVFPQAGVYIWRVRAGAATLTGKVIRL
ncbi:MAG: T9SS type A sorting domain-containing protein [Saprospiraceae bacterium]|nr:T9SS type A sorting domain-containing protein [Saprospiraceae bacterium]